MDFIKKAVGGDNNNQEGQHNQGSSSGGYNNNNNNNNQQHSSASGEKKDGGFLSGIGDKLNGAAGGGPESEKNEDYLDKGVDFVQEHVMGQGPQDNESAFEQAKDEKISDFIRGKYKDSTGKEIPIEDKKTTWG